MKIRLFRSTPNVNPLLPRIVDVEDVEVEFSDYTDVLGTDIRFPHCDALILHSPSTCRFCDLHPDWQALRSAQGIAFSDTSDTDRVRNNLVPCPSTWWRSAEVRDRWHGNTASPR